MGRFGHDAGTIPDADALYIVFERHSRRCSEQGEDRTMADRVLRGSRLGAVSYETDRDHDLAPRRVARYRTDNGEEFDVPFADDAEIPGTWLCRNGLEGSLLEGTAPEAKKVKPPRTHWDMLLERRSVEELEELLKERLDLLKVKRRGVSS